MKFNISGNFMKGFLKKTGEVITKKSPVIAATLGRLLHILLQSNLFLAQLLVLTDESGIPTLLHIPGKLDG